MKYLFSPVRNDARLIYNFNDEIITVKYQEGDYSLQSPQIDEEAENLAVKEEEVFIPINEIEDVFDFSQIPNGKILAEEIETSLPVNPILKGERIEGNLELELLYYHGPKASQEERFPEWEEVK